MQLEIEIRSDNARNDVYELRNIFQDEHGIRIQIKEQAPAEGEMSVAVVEPIITGVVEALVGHSIAEIYSKLLKPKINKWLESRKQGNLEVLSTLKDEGTRIHFLENNTGRSEVFENLTYAIDIDHTRALLIGNSEFDGGFSAIPPVKGNLEDFYHLLTDKLHVGLLPENIVIAFNKTNTEIEEMLLRQSKMPDTETLIIYFAGHGHRTDVKKLYLVAKNSRRIDDYLLGGIDFDFVSNVILRNATAKQKILILDACHSGIATQGADDMMQKIDVKGSYVLASSPGDEVSYFDKSSRNTYFTGVLLNALKQGIENANEMIALEDLYEYSRDHLSEKNFPHPISKNELNIPASNFFIARNPLFSFEKLKQRPEQLLSQGRFEEALYEYRLLLQKYPDDLQLRKKASECESGALFTRLAQDGDELFFHVKDYKAAMEKYRKALQINDDMLVRSKLRRCQDYLQNSSTEEKKAPQKVPDNLKKVVPELKRQKTDEQRKKERQPMEDGVQKKFAITITDNTTGIILAALWLVFSLILVVSLFDDKPIPNTFYKGSLPAIAIGVVLMVARWKYLGITEVLLYSHGLFICIFPLIAGFADSKEDTSGAVILLLFYIIGFAIMVIKKLKQFKIADMVIAAVSMVYLSPLFFSVLLYKMYQSKYDARDTASTTGLIIGLVLGIATIVFVRKKWIESKRR